MTAAWRRTIDRLGQPVDGASLAAFRFLIGALLCVGCVRFLFSGWIPRFFDQPTYFFSYPGFEWVQAGPLWFMYALYGALAVLALFIAVGFLYRPSALLFTVGFTYAELIDVTNYLNHYYLVTLFGLLLTALPLHRVWSVDARIRPGLAKEPLRVWMLWLLRFQVAVVYFYAGLAKVQPDWLLSAQPLNVWFQARTELPVIGGLLAEPWVAYVASWFGAFFDLTIVGWLLWSRTRAAAYVFVLLFHGLTALFFNIGLFPYLMVTSATLMFAPSWPRRFVRLPETSLSAPRHPGRPVLTVCALYCVFQLLMPLRHYVYPGDVLWNEDGMRWSWKVMVREKHGSVTYRVKLESGKELQVSPRRYLTARQMREMAGQPDLILRLAHHIADEFAAKGQAVEVRADTLTSLNGRPAVPMLDPDVDLATVPETLAPSAWVLPRPTSKTPLLSVSR